MAGARKVVTVVFADVAGFTALGEELDAEVVRRVIERYFGEARSVLEQHGGKVEKFIGDAVMAVFGIPLLHDDDALRAVRAATELQGRLTLLNDELERDWGVRIAVRTGINTGEVVAGGGAATEAFATGDAVNVAARLEQTAGPGEILIGDTTRGLLREAIRVEAVESLALRGKAEPVRAWRLLEVLPDAPAFTRPIRAPFIGREAELAELEEAFASVVEERSCRLVTVLGPPGIGKSRLARELLAAVGERVRVVVGRCVPYGEGITYWPLTEIVDQVAGRDSAGIVELVARSENAELIAERIAGAVGLVEAEGRSEEIAWAVRKLFEALSRESPLVVVLDDIHWAEPTFLDLIEYLAGFTAGPVLLLALARPDLLDERASWTVPRPNASTIFLEPLSEDEAEELIEKAGGFDLSESALRQIAEASEGNPLFVEQLLAFQAENGGADNELIVPPTIQALLAARIDRLGPAERAVIERGSVEGRSFHRGAVFALLPETSRVSLGGDLMSLVRKELIRPDRAEFADDDGFRFVHALVQDAAYASMAKELRAELHERYAGWLEAAASGRMGEYQEILGYHLEQAHRSRAQLGPLDEHAEGVGRRAAECLAAAGRRALARGDAHAATNLLERALALVPPADPFGLELAPELTDALVLAGKFERAEQVATAAIEAADDSRHRLLALLLLSDVRTFTEPEGSLERLRSVAESALPELEKAHDDKGLARAWAAIAWTHHIAMRFQPAIDAFEHAFAHARRAGDERQANQALIQIGIELIYGPTPAEEAIRRCNAVLEDTSISRWGEMGFLDALAVHEAMLGHFDAARELVARVRTMTEDLGLARGLPFILRAEHGWIVETLAGNPGAAEREIRVAYEALEQMGEKGLLSTQAARLAQSLYALQRYVEAEDYTKISEQVGASDDIVTQVLWRQVRAKALARRGQVETAEELARDAVALAEPTDALDMRADGLVDLAEVLRLIGRTDETTGVLEGAVRLYEQKGDVVSAARARSVLANPDQT